MKRVLAFALGILLCISGTAYAAVGLQHVLINGNPADAGKIAATVDKGTLYFNADEVFKQLGVEFRLDSAASTLYVTDKTLAENADLKAKLKTAQDALADAKAQLAKLQPQPTDVAPPTQTATPAEQLAATLNSKLGHIKTAIGNVDLSFTVQPNLDNSFPQDLDIKIEYGDLLFSNLAYRIDITAQDKQSTLAQLRDLENQVYQEAAKAFPNKKIKGEFYSWTYDYPDIQVGFHSSKDLSWANFTWDLLSTATEYDSAHISSFHFAPEWDSHKFN